jgi:predicted O-methyltransferase YrrM
LSGYSKIRSALINPKKALSYLFLGKEKFHALRNLSEHSCFQIESSSILESYMTHPTDIHEHLQTLYMLTIELNLKNTLELGTRTGESTVSLLLAAKEVNGKVTSIDIDSCNDAKEKVKKSNLESFWNFHQTDDLKLKWEDQIDHLFIDTSHTYDQTLAELQKFEPWVRKGGLISLHDIVSCPPVLRAINDYILERNDIKFYKFFHNNGLGILRKSD